ncbi:beta-galactosidase [Pedobacter nutrimenti]|uniref:beta-galactosidase n=1 Tax=Pedobacter nutrimenti TaxID=1241337 RepID=UPI002931C90A|nr:beta-galactosidase [Pedobacter nutrimenti]
MKTPYILGLILYLGLNSSCCKKTSTISATIEDKTNLDLNEAELIKAAAPFKNMLGINGFEWEYIKGNGSNQLDNDKVGLISTFSGFRHYLDWEKIEPKEGVFNLNFYDQIYQKNKELGIQSLICLQIMPGWMRKTYSDYNPSDPYSSLRDYTPVPQGSDKAMPVSYVSMAKAGYQLAARYGANSDIDPNLIKHPSYESSPKIGLNVLDYIECSNEPDKNWKGPQAQQSPEQYAAQLSAFYDGHMGTLGKDAGVKTADPKMKVVMAGIADPNPEFVKRIIDWCRINRIKDGKYTLCFDVINYHQYANDNWKSGKAPELSNIGDVASRFIKLSKDYADNRPVWVTECGFDVNNKSPQRALAIGNKTTYDTQADWILRTALLYARKGIKRTFFYMLNDVNLQDATQYSSSGLIENTKRRASGDYIFQTRKLMGDFIYQRSLSMDPIVDLYVSDHKKIYVLTIPDQKGTVKDYTLKLDKEIKEATIYTPTAGANEMLSKKVKTDNQQLLLRVTETPIFVQTN